MPSIWNVNQSYNANSRKVSSKLTFSNGESFSAKIISKGEGNEVKIKLPDGWQFSAEVEGEANFTEEDILKFEVINLENGKLKLKIVNNQVENSDVNKDSLSNIAKREGLDTSDVKLLKDMISHNIPLTRENIKYIKSIIQFSDRVNNDPKEIEKFINNLIDGKNIDVNSKEAAAIKEVLSSFLNEFKKLSKEDILLFLENKIDINKESIESYNKLFKSDNSLKEYFQEVNSNLQQLKIHIPEVDGSNINNKSIPQYKDNINNDNINTQNKSNVLPTKVYDYVEVDNGKSSMLNLLKSMMNIETDAVKGIINNILSDRMNEFSINEYNNAISNLKNIDDGELVKLIKNNLDSQGELKKEGVESVLTNIFNKDIKINVNEYNKVFDALKSIVKSSDGYIQDEISVKNILKNALLNIKDNINSNEYNEALNKIDEIAVTKFIQQVNSTGEGINKDSINSVISELISKDIKLSDNEIKNLVKLLNDENIKSNDLEFKNINEVKGVPVSKEDVMQTNNMISKDIVKKEILSNADSIKDVVKDIIKVVENTGLESSKILEFVKSNINDFKLLNSISNEYYYLDIPISQQGKEYPCKLIIKDKRKEGKKIDSTNVKVVVSVKTINLGSIDGYLNIRNSNINVDLKCDESIINILEKGKEKLIESLRGMDLIPSVTISKKIDDVSLTNCREFFNEGKISLIDRMV